VRVEGATKREVEQEEFNAVLRHPARQARLGLRVMLECRHEIAEATAFCKHCRAEAWQIYAQRLGKGDVR